MTWSPSTILTFLRAHRSSASPVFVETDAGDAVVKTLGNGVGPHALACEWIGANLARALGLRTFDFAILEVRKIPPLELTNGEGLAIPGPAFATRHERGEVWSGSPVSLERVRNKSDISALIVFDTLIRNRDRWAEGRNPNYDNVFLSSERTTGREVELVVMDHTHCLSDNDLTPPALARATSDPRIYGAFPAFLSHWSEEETCDTQKKLSGLDSTLARSFVQSLPRQWQVEAASRDAIVEFIVARAESVARRHATDFRPKEAPV